MTAAPLTLAGWLLAGAASGVPPLVNVCWDYGCDRNERLILPAPHWQRIAGLLDTPAPDPAIERERVATAIALFETAVGSRTDTDRDRGGNVSGSGQNGQQDCIDESLNTDGYLRVLAERGLLHWHRVGARERRAPWLFDQHWTAVLVDRTDGRAWAVDSWFLDNGRRPYVQPLEAWRDKEPLPPNPDA